MDSVEAVEKILNYSFVNKTLLKEALMHTNKGQSSAEPSLLFKRLEFLGDSVLEVAFANYIHHAYPNLKLHELCNLRTANVSNEKFARVAVNHNLYQFIVRQNPSLSKKVKEFSEAVSKEVDPVPYGGLVKPPKHLADIVESIAGAVYIDVNYDVQRLWEIFRDFLEPIYTPDDLRLQPKPPFLTLFRLADKHGKRIDFRYSKDDDSRKTIAEVYLDDIFIASGCAKRIDTAKLLAAEGALQKLSECMPIEKIIGEDSPHVDPEDAKGKSIEICSTELQTESSSFPTASENPLTDEMTQDQMVIHEHSPHVEPEDVKQKSFEICSTEKLQLQAESSSFPSASENPLTDEMTQEQIVMDEDNPHVEPRDAKGKLFEICSSRKLQIQTGSSSLPSASANPLTSEMTTKQMVVDNDSLNIEPENMKGKLFEICTKNKWPRPIFSVEEERGQKNEQKFVCSVKIEIPTIEGSFHKKGDAKSTKKQAENSSAYHMISALKSSLMSIVISNLRMPNSLDKKKNPSLFGSEMDSDSVEAVEKILNYSFVNKNLLKEALTYNDLPLYKRLMFVGEPALSLAFMKHLYLTYPKLAPKDLSLLRDANTCNDRHARVAVKKGIYQFFTCNVPKPERMIIEFIEFMGKEDDPDPDPDPDPYRFVNASKILANLVNAVAGAVYIDVNYNVQRLWEIIRGLFEPIICTPDDLRQQAKTPFLTLFRLAEKHGKRIDFRYSKDDDSRKKIAEVYLDDIFIASGCARRKYTAKLLAAEEALQKLSEGMPIVKSIDEDTPHVEPEDMKEKSFEFCSTKKLQKQFGSSSLPPASENPLTDGTTQEQMVTDEDSPHVEPEDVNAKSFEICSTEKHRLQAESSSFPIAFVNPLTDELTQDQIIVDENSLHVEPENVKGKLFEICPTRKLQTETGSSSLPSASENPSTYEMTTKQMVVDKGSLHVENEDVKGKLFEICAKNKWPNPIFSVEEERGPKNEQKFVCSVKIEIPTIEGTFHMKGDVKSKKKQAEKSSACHMIRALKSSIMSLVINNLQLPKSLHEKKKKKKNLQMQESLDENKNLHSKKRRIF